METQKSSSSWWTEGNRKLIMVGVALFVFGAIVITWLIVQPEGVGLEQLGTWVGGIISALTTLGVGGNVLEHRARAGSSASTLGKVGVLLLLLLLLGGCGGSGPVTVGDLLPGVQVARDARGCLALEIAQPVPVEGYEVTTTVSVREKPGESGGCGADAKKQESPRPEGGGDP